jgi:branched-subunit amino acid transport protein AzlD
MSEEGLDADATKESFDLFKQKRDRELKSLLVLVLYDLIAVIAILAALTIISQVLEAISKTGTVTPTFLKFYHACHEGTMLVLLVCLCFRTVDHFVGGFLSQLLWRSVDRLWGTEK